MISKFRYANITTLIQLRGQVSFLYSPIVVIYGSYQINTLGENCFKHILMHNYKYKTRAICAKRVIYIQTFIEMTIYRVTNKVTKKINCILYIWHLDKAGSRGARGPCPRQLKKVRNVLPFPGLPPPPPQLKKK